jgi:hypothetical protein
MIWLPLTISDWPIIMFGPSGLLLVVSQLFAVPVLVLLVGLENEITILGCEIYFCKVTYWALLEMLLCSNALSLCICISGISKVPKKAPSYFHFPVSFPSLLCLAGSINRRASNIQSRKVRIDLLVTKHKHSQGSSMGKDTRNTRGGSKAHQYICGLLCQRSARGTL